MCELLAEGKQRDKVEMLGYLFYVSDKNKTDLPYLDESKSTDPWFRYRREEILTHDRIVEEAQILQEKYGFKAFKLKGGVLDGAYEMDTCRALKKAFPDARINIDPNGCWSLEEAIALCKPMENVLSYIEDPTGPQAGFSSREVMAEFKNAVHLPVATNMIATNWRQFYHAAALKAVDIVLADPHFWGMEGSLRMAALLKDWGLTWGSHSNNHFDITLATFAQVGAAAPGNPTALDTHWIWQDGQNLLKDTPQIKDGYLEVPDKPGLGVTLDMDKVMKANKLYNAMPSHDRNDAMAMQYLIPNWNMTAISQRYYICTKKDDVSMKILQKLDKNFEYIVLALMLSTMCLLSFANVISRYVFNQALTWSDEVCCYLLAISAFFCLPCAIRNNSTLKVDTFTNIFPIQFANPRYCM